MTNLHSTQTKKSYRKPVLVKRGNVAKLTRGGTGGSSDNFQTQKNG
ncbi:lasso RiPP family leader peptide-containing protein [Dyadobacter sp. CY345]